jgi:hypothetical protein
MLQRKFLQMEINGDKAHFFAPVNSRFDPSVTILCQILLLLLLLLGSLSPHLWVPEN